MKLLIVWNPRTGKVINELKDVIPSVQHLASFYFLQGKGKDRFPPPKKYYLDSGAFSAFVTGTTIDIDQYIDFIKNNSDEISYYFNLDVVGNAEETYANQKYIEEQGLKPIPVFHANEDFKWLQKYIDEGHQYIALGGVAQLRDRVKIVRWLKKCFKIIPKTIKVHGFAITSSVLLDIFPFYSVDSSSWCSGSRYGQSVEFRKGKIKQIKKRTPNTTENNTILNKWNLYQWKLYAKYLQEMRKWK